MILSRVCSLAGSFLGSRELGELGCHSQVSTCSRKYNQSPRGFSWNLSIPVSVGRSPAEGREREGRILLASH